MGRPSRPDTALFFETFYYLMNCHKNKHNYDLYEMTEEKYISLHGYRRFANYSVFKVSYHRLTKKKKKL